MAGRGLCHWIELRGNRIYLNKKEWECNEPRVDSNNLLIYYGPSVLSLLRKVQSRYNRYYLAKKSSEATLCVVGADVSTEKKNENQNNTMFTYNTNSSTYVTSALDLL